MSAAVLAGLAVPAVLEAVKTGLSHIDHPAAAGVVNALATLQSAVTNGAIAPDQMAALHTHIEKMAEIEAGVSATTITQVNESLRAEVASTDPYVRRMRPTFGYMMALTWGAQMLAVAYIIIADPDRAGSVIAAIANLGVIWSVALSVMGIYVYQRSAEKIAGVLEQSPANQQNQRTPVYND